MQLEHHISACIHPAGPRNTNRRACLTARVPSDTCPVPVSTALLALSAASAPVPAAYSLLVPLTPCRRRQLETPVPRGAEQNRGTLQTLNQTQLSSNLNHHRDFPLQRPCSLCATCPVCCACYLKFASLPEPTGTRDISFMSPNC
jgi:hypothetical protein